MRKAGPVRVAIACQGGGSHTAFTAGVLRVILKALLQRAASPQDDVQIVALSGTSGGAVCALLAWDGLLRDDPERGSARLEGFWEDNTASDPWSALVNDSVQIALHLRSFVAFPQVNPYAVPPLGQKLLRDLLEKWVAFAELRALARQRREPGLVLGAVEVRSGRFDVFRGPEIGVEAVLASAALPDFFRAVRVPGRGVYWDGLFSQNPPIRELTDYEPDELWVVQINPTSGDEVPTTVDAIADRRNALAGNLSLEQELRFIEKINELLSKGLLHNPVNEPGKYRPIAVSRIPLQLGLSSASKLDRSPAFIHRLLAHGETEAQHFLEKRRLRQAGAEA